MLIDHIGAIVISKYIYANGGYYSLLPWEGDGSAISIIYSITRLIGRLAFPIYCFLIVEGFFHTKNIKKMILTLGLFAIISEIPFNLALSDTIKYPSAQNVFVTLFLGVVAMQITKILVKKYGFNGKFYGLFLAVAIAYVNEYIGGDYGYYGIFFIIILYNLRFERTYQAIAAFALGIAQYSAALSSLLIYQYNGQRGRQPKYFFYIFYPAHLLLLYFLNKMIL